MYPFPAPLVVPLMMSTFSSPLSASHVQLGWVFTVTLLSFAVWTCAALYAFTAKTPWRAVWVSASLAAILYLPAWLFPELAVRP